MIEKVIRYQTKDGVLHEDRSDADAHIVRMLEDTIGPIIDGVNKELPPHQAVSHKAKMEIVATLVGTTENAKRLKSILDRFLD